MLGRGSPTLLEMEKYYYEEEVQPYQKIVKHNFMGENMLKSHKYMKNESWNNSYYSGTQRAFIEFQGPALVDKITCSVDPLCLMYIILLFVYY